MADYVSSYPTLWPVSDMLAATSAREAERGREENSEEPDPHHARVTFSLISAPLRDLSGSEKVNILL